MNTHRETTFQERFPRRALAWQLRRRTLRFGRRPLLMGVVNVTPDSFSDGGEYLDPASAVQHALHLADQGADILDIGGESTRPYATPVGPKEELRRVMPVVQAVCQATNVPVSIDTSHAEVAHAAVAAGAEIINDVTALTGDKQMLAVARGEEAGLCLMHMQGTPQTMQDNPTYDDVVENIFEFLKLRRDALVASDIAPERICLDPGIGFGKTCRHNLTLLSHCGRFHELGHPLLVGPSRKGFLSEVLGDPRADRTAATLGVAMSLARQGVQVIRVHDVQQVRHALLLFEATGGIDRKAGNLT